MKTWFEQARFGMFIHWGHSSQQGCELSALSELLTNYSQMDVIWFDGGRERSPEQWQAE